MRRPGRGWRRGAVEREREWNPRSESAKIQKRVLVHAPSSAAQQTALYILVLEDKELVLRDEELVLEDEELVLEGEQRTALEAGSRERNERLRWSAAMRRMLLRSRDVGRSSAHTEGETKRLAVGGSGGRREEVTAAALVGKSRRKRWRNRRSRVNSGRKGEGGTELADKKPG